MHIEIKQPLRILATGAPGSRILDVVKDLTGSSPALNPEGTTAGLIHTWEAKTAYYTASIPIWIDEIADVEAWKQEFLKPEAKEVVQAVGAWIYCFEAHEDGGVSQEVDNIMRGIKEIVEEHGGLGGEGARLGVCIPGKGVEVKADEWEDVCLDHGFEFVSYGAEGKNEYGEKMGFERLKEALEANEWTADVDEDDALGFEDLDDFEDIDDFGISGREEAEWTNEFFGVKAALASRENEEEGEEGEEDAEDVEGRNGQADQVDDLDRMMSKLLAVKEQSADLPEAQRKRMAARAVREVMGHGASSA